MSILNLRGSGSGGSKLVSAARHCGYILKGVEDYGWDKLLIFGFRSRFICVCNFFIFGGLSRGVGILLIFKAVKAIMCDLQYKP